MALLNRVKPLWWLPMLLFFSVLLFTNGITFSSESFYQNQQYTTKRANVRSCARLDCSVLVTLQKSISVTILEQVQGVSVNGSTVWYQITVGGQNGYIHSTLVSATNQPTTK